MKSWRLQSIAGLLAICWSGVSPLAAAEDFEQMIRRVPETANALVLVDADRVFASPVAQEEKWQDDRAERFAAGLTAIPPKANRVVIAAQFDFEFMQPIWEFALVESEKPALLSTVAREFGGVLDKVVGMPAVRLPDDAFIVELSEHLRGAMTPANRQQTSRWVALANHNLSPYLTEAATFADKAAHVIMAFDTTGAMSADEVKTRMGANMDIYKDILKDSPVEPQELAELLAGMQGVTLGITFTDRAYGSMKIDFSSDATKLEPIAKPLLLAILAHRGAMIEDFNDWTLQVKGTQIFLKGQLSSSGVMRLSSLIELPTHVIAAPNTEQQTAASENTQTTPPTVAQSTQEYFKRTEGILQDLRRHKGEAKTIGTIGLWFGNYANKIDRLPMLNVDPEMLDYGSYLSSQLRNCSQTIKGVGIQQRPAEIEAGRAAGGGGISANVYGYAGWGGYGRYGNFNAWGSGADYVAARMAGNGAAHSMFMASQAAMRTEQAARVQVRSQLRAQGASTVQGILAQVEEATAKVRREMTQKYQVNF